MREARNAWEQRLAALIGVFEAAAALKVARLTDTGEFRLFGRDGRLVVTGKDHLEDFTAHYGNGSAPVRAGGSAMSDHEFSTPELYERYLCRQ
jgi:hypothetical protein